MKKIYFVKFEFNMEGQKFIGMYNMSCEPNCIGTIKPQLYKKFKEVGYEINNLIITAIKGERILQYRNKGENLKLNNI